MFQGSMVAIVTPFDGDKVDKGALENLIEFQIENGTNVIVPCGTTGESATLSHSEHLEVIKIAVDTSAGRVPVLAGTGSNSTQEAVQLTEEAKGVGADGALVITPYYNKPTQEGLYRHFEQVAGIGLPIVMYNVPGRTGVNMLPETVARLAPMKNIVGIKEASGSLTQITKVIHLCGDADFSLYSGDDFIVVPILSVGGKGVISVSANIIPREMSDMIKFFNDGELEKAASVQRGILKLCDAMFMETNPTPVKTSLAMMGKIKEEFRLPLCQMSEENRKALQSVLSEYSLVG